MGRKILVSYKYADENVYPVPNISDYRPNARDYVAWLEKKFTDRTGHVYKGEHDYEDLSDRSDDYIWSKLKRFTVLGSRRLWIPITGFLLTVANLWGLAAEEHYLAFGLGVLLLAAIIGTCVLWMSVRHKRGKVAAARILVALLLLEGVLMIYNNILLTLHQLMYRHGLLMSQRLMGLPLFVAGYIVCMQLLQYRWEVRRNRRLFLETIVRLLVSGAMTFFAVVEGSLASEPVSDDGLVDGHHDAGCPGCCDGIDLYTAVCGGVQLFLQARVMVASTIKFL